MKKISNIVLSAVISLTLLTSCNKNKPYETAIAPSQAHFISNTQFMNYYVRNASADSFIIQVGTTDVSNVDRTVTFNITSPSGAVNGTDYSVVTPATGKAVTIKAGEAIGSIKLHGTFGSYSGGGKDTLVFTLAAPSIPAAGFSDTLKVILQSYCDVDPTTFVGSYTKSFDIQTGSPTYGPYKTEITSGALTTTGATSGYITVSNFWDVGGPEIRINLDWADPANFNTTVPAQFLYTDPSYGAATITGVGAGSFSSCDNTFKISYKVTVSAGSFGNYITKIAR